MKIKCVIIDDEPLAIKVVENHLKEFQNFEIIKTFNNPLEALPLLEEGKVDVLFLDINMPKMNGLDFAKTLNTKTNVVITTAYREYAVESFDLNVLDYLVKPIAYPRFEAMCTKALEFNDLKRDAAEISHVPEAGHIFVKSDQKMIKVNYSAIKYIEAFADYVKIYVVEGKRIVTLQTMKKMNELLPSNKFCRIHRSYIINLSKISSYNGTEVSIEDKVIPIGKNFKQDFVAHMKS